MVRIFNEEIYNLVNEQKGRGIGKALTTAGSAVAKDIGAGLAQQAVAGGFRSKEEVVDAAKDMAKQIAIEKGIEVGEKALEVAATKVASQAGAAALKKVPLADVAYAAYDLATSGDDGSWKSKLKNWGRAGGELAGGWGGGIVAGAAATPETLGAAAVPAFIAGKMAGGAAGGFVGEKAGELLGSILDKFTGGDKTGAAKDLAAMMLVGGPVNYMLQNAVKDLFIKDKEADSEDFEKLTNAAQKELPDSLDDEADDLANIAATADK